MHSTNDPNDLEGRLKLDVELPNAIIALTLILWGALILCALFYVVGANDWQNRLMDAAVKILLPLFNSTIAASLTYIFGKPVAKAVANRLLH